MTVTIDELSADEIAELAKRIQESVGSSDFKLHRISPATNACTVCGSPAGVSVVCDVQPIGQVFADEAWRAWA